MADTVPDDNPMAALPRPASKTGDYTDLCTFSPAIYDSAWLSMVYKDNGQPAFPQCFARIIEKQQQNGTWPAYGSPVDSIINSLAALLSLITRARIAPADKAQYGLEHRIGAAKQGIDALLQSWTVSTTKHVGFEVIVPSLLRQLAQFGIRFTFPDQEHLEGLWRRKMERFTPELIYSNHEVSILHSAEALVGEIDFDRIAHHISPTCGLYGSPAATAAYLTHISVWDERAEEYLKRVLAYYGDTGDVPSAYPTSVFEVSWSVSVLLSASPELADHKHDDLLCKKDFLASTLEAQEGLVGFSPGVLVDADDTARTLIALRRLGVEIDPTPLIKRFATPDGFKTYDLERDPSFTTNCNVLIALLEGPQTEDSLQQVTNVLEFLLRRWDSSQISDKWNLLSAYSTMLLAESLTLLLKRLNDGCLDSLPVSINVARIAAVLARLCHAVLRNPGDLKRDSVEATSYTALTLVQLLRLPWSDAVQGQLHVALGRARCHIMTGSADSEDGYPWLEKTTFQVASLRRAYCAAAVTTKCPEDAWSLKIQAEFSIAPPNLEHAKSLLAAMPLFENFSLDHMELVLLQSQWYSVALDLHRQDLIPEDRLPIVKGKYLRYIPLIWLACDSIGSEGLPPIVLWDMMKLSLYIYQVDELMEALASDLDEGDFRALLRNLRSYCRTDQFQAMAGADLTQKHDGLDPEGQGKVRKQMNAAEHGTLAEEAVFALQKFLDFVLQHPAVRRISAPERQLMTSEVLRFIEAHHEHNRDNRAWAKLRANRTAFILDDEFRGCGFYGWAATTAAADTSCPFAFRWFSHLIAENGRACFDGPEARYYSHSVAHHLSVMCRLYNDCGSADRDMAEGNLNSMDFAEFGDFSKSFAETDGTHGEKAAMAGEMAGTRTKGSLMAIANFERSMMKLALERLALVVSKKTMADLKVFVDVTDLFGQMYIQRDLSSRRQQDMAR